jgi:hypothetical protein
MHREKLEKLSEDLRKKGKKKYFIKMRQNTPQLCWGDEWLPLSPGGRGLG